MVPEAEAGEAHAEAVAAVAGGGGATGAVLVLAVPAGVTVAAGLAPCAAVAAARLAADGVARTVLMTWVTQKPFSSLAPAAQLAYLTGALAGAAATATGLNAVGDSAADETAP